MRTETHSVLGDEPKDAQVCAVANKQGLPCAVGVDAILSAMGLRELEAQFQRSSDVVDGAMRRQKRRNVRLRELATMSPDPPKRRKMHSVEPTPSHLAKQGLFLASLHNRKPPKGE